MKLRILRAGWIMATVLWMHPWPGWAEESPLSLSSPWPTQINTAEAIIEPFWSKEISGFEAWSIDSGAEYGLSIRQNWSAVDFEWASAPKSGPALHMARQMDVDCLRYDRLMVRLTVPVGCSLRLRVETDRGERAMSSTENAGKENEFFLPLEGAARIKSVVIELWADQPGPANGWLRWVGLQSTARLTDYQAQWDFRGMDWTAYLQRPDFTPTFTPRYGIFLSETELSAQRDAHAAAMARGESSRFAILAEQAQSMSFEAGIHEFVWSGGEADMHGRVRDAELTHMPGGPELAEAALVLRDAGLMRMAARYALSTAISGHWEKGFMSSLPGGPWEDRVFTNSYVCKDIAKILDMAGEIFSDAGRSYLLRRLAETGVGPINYVTWRYEYVHQCNQLAYFNLGRICAYAVMEREWPRVKPYMDLACQDTIDSLTSIILPDGGYVEGPSYFCASVGGSLAVLDCFARARKQDAAVLAPDVLRRTENYAAAVASTTHDDVIPICDASSGRLSLSRLEPMVRAMPGGCWERLLGKRRAIDAGQPAPDTGLPNLVVLPETGLAASVRSWQGEKVKILILGNHAGGEHTHEDKGSFVLEFAGDAFAMDPGVCEYDDPMHHQYKQCQRHAMLVPVDIPERAHPANPLPVNIRPEAQGDATMFHAQMQLTPGWEPYYKVWNRTWDSPAPDTLTIRDEYTLAQGKAVEFYWSTRLPVRMENAHAIIQGTRGQVRIPTPEGCTMRLDVLPLAGSEEQHRIAIRKEAAEGVLEVTAQLSLAVEPALGDDAKLQR